MQPDPNTQNRQAYDRIVHSYAQRNIEMVPYVEKAAEQMLNAVQSTAEIPQRLLDVGCGTGRDMHWFETRGMKMLGADLSSGMLHETQQKVQGGLVQADMTTLPYRSAWFGGVWCQAALLHLPKAKVPQALAEMRRVLAPAGYLYVAVQLGNSEGFETRPYEPVVRYYAHYQKEELHTFIREAGLTIVQTGEGVERRQWIWALSKKR